MPGFSTRATLLSLALLIALGAAGWWYHANHIADPVYEATARFQQRCDFDVVDSSNSKALADEYRKIKKLMVYNFKGTPAIAQVARDLGLTQRFPQTDDGVMTDEAKAHYDVFIDTLSDCVSVKVEIETPHLELVAVTVRHKDNVLATKLAAKLVENYITHVEREIDNMLVDQKKFYDTEVNRYRRKVAELENAKLRFAKHVPNLPGIDPLDPISVYNALHANGQKEVHARALKQLTRLRELTKDKPVGEAVILELYKLECEVEAAEEAIKAAEENREQLEILNRNFFQIRNDYLKIEREMKESQEQLAFWSGKLREVQTALALSLGQRGVRLSFVERPPEPYPDH